jgi:hypothetical protein
MVLTSTTDVYMVGGIKHFTWRAHACTLNMQQQVLKCTYKGSPFSDSLTLKMKALRFFETSGITQQHRHKMATSKPQAQTLQVLSKTWHESVGAAYQQTSRTQANNSVWNTCKYDDIVTRRRLYTTSASAYRIDNRILMIDANRLTKKTLNLRSIYRPTNALNKVQ